MKVKKIYYCYSVLIIKELKSNFYVLIKWKMKKKFDNYLKLNLMDELVYGLKDVNVERLMGW